MPITKLSKYFFSKNFALLSSGSLLFLLAGVINLNNERPELILSKQDTAINLNKNIYLFLNAGNKRLLTDILWVQTLIESDLERYQKRDLNNWLFLRFNSIAMLDPLFYENYFYGGQFLAIVKDDLEGADLLYEKGIAVYPDDYNLNFNAGFLNYYEMGNFEKGINYLSKIEGNPKAPPYVRSIINKLLLASGLSLEEVFNLVNHNYHTNKDERLKQKLQGDLYAIKAEIDLVCLNNKKPNCSRRDFLGDPYIEKDGLFYSKKYFLRFAIKKREGDEAPSRIEPINFLK